MRPLRRLPTSSHRINPNWNRRKLWLSALEDRTAPAVFTVNTTADTGAAGDTTTLTGELRWAIATANDEINFPGPDTINITATGTLSLIGGEMMISTPMTINGPGAKLLTIDGGSTTRIFKVNDGVNDTAMPLAISKVTLANGNAGTGPGGAMYLRDEDLTLTDCTVSNSKAGTYGGGIYFFVRGKMTMRGCTISGNSAGVDGGGLYSNGAAQWLIENSTISGNTAEGLGGGLCVISWAEPGTFTMRFSTVTNNTSKDTAGGGGGVRVTPGGPLITLENTIVSGNFNPGGTAPDFRAGTVDMKFSAVGSNLGFTPNKIAGNLEFGLNLKLGTLFDNGGPTKTHIPMAGSPLRNIGGTVGALTLDQRGQPRPLDGLADIGSVESPDPTPSAKLVAIPNILVPSALPNTVTITYSDAQSNIALASIDPTDIEILAPDGMTKLTVTKVTTDVMVNAPTINATYTFNVPSGTWNTGNVGSYSIKVLANAISDTDTPTANGILENNVGAFRNLIPQVFTVDLKIDENDGNFAPGDLSLREALILANKNLGSADTIVFDGAIFANQEKINLTLGELPVNDQVTIIGPSKSVILDANAAGRVMKISVPGLNLPVNISNVIFQNGKLTGTVAGDVNNRGGGVFVEDEIVTLTNVQIRNNESFATGGGIFLQSNGSAGSPGQLIIRDSLISNNKSVGSGGFNLGSGAGISIGGAASLTMQRTTVTGNTAGTQGGGVYFYSSGSLDMSQCLLSGNVANGGAGGGGFYFYGTAVNGLKISNSTISGNKAPIGVGGGIAMKTLNGTSQLQIRNSTVAFNESTLGGGISRSGGSSTTPLLLSSTIVAKNISSSTGQDINLDATASDVPGNNNLIGITGDGGFVMTGLNNILGDPFTPEDPLLDPVLANNGGPTLTHKFSGTSKAIDAGIANGFTTDQRGGAAVRIFNDPVPNGPGSDGTDIGAFERQPVTAPSVMKIEFNGGAAQRSLVTSATVTFSEAVFFPNGILSAFQLNRYANGTPGLVNLNATQAGSVVTLTFVAGGVVGIDAGGSLQDGTYELTVVGSNVQGGLAGLAGNTTSKVHRLFGDSNGDGTVNAVDFNAFRMDYGSPGPSIFDFDGVSGVNATDFNAFRLRYGVSGYQP